MTALADNLLVSEALLSLGDVDLAKWSSWLAAAGYTNKAGWRKIAEAARAQVGGCGAEHALLL